MDRVAALFRALGRIGPAALFTHPLHEVNFCCRNFSRMRIPHVLRPLLVWRCAQSQALLARAGRLFPYAPAAALVSFQPAVHRTARSRQYSARDWLQSLPATPDNHGEGLKCQTRATDSHRSKSSGAARAPALPIT